MADHDLARPPANREPLGGDVPNRERAAERATLQAAAAAAVGRLIAEPDLAKSARSTAHPVLSGIGHALGVGLGVIVTEALRLVPSYGKPVLDAAGAPVASVPGTDRIGNHDILERHKEVIGPKINAYVAGIPDGALHDFVAGLGAGASEAPGDSYRLDVYLEDLIARNLPTS